MNTEPDWAGMTYQAFDVETGGTNVWEDRIITAALVTVQAGRELGRRTWLINPGEPISQESIAVHGITNEQLAEEGMEPAQALFEITGLLAVGMRKVVPTVVANAPFDFTILEAENRRHNIDSLHSRLAGRPIGPVIDPMVLDKKADTYRKAICETNRIPCRCGAVDKKLSSLCLHYGITLTNAHDAGADALAAALLVPAIIAKHPSSFRGLTVGGLHQAQVGWRREQMDSLRAYFDKAGTVHDGCAPDWPILKRPVEVAQTQGALL